MKKKKKYSSVELSGFARLKTLFNGHILQVKIAEKLTKVCGVQKCALKFTVGDEIIDFFPELFLWFFSSILSCTCHDFHKIDISLELKLLTIARILRSA